MPQLGGAGSADRGGGQLQDAGEVEVLAVAGDGRGVAPQQRGERGAAQRNSEAGHRVVAPEGGADDSEHGTGRRVHDGPAGRRAARPERVAALRAERQFQGGGEPVVAAVRRVGHRGLAQDARGAPAECGDADIGAGADRVPDGQRQGWYAEVLPAEQGEAQFGQGGDRFGPGTARPAVRSVQHGSGEAGDHLMAGHHRAPVVGDEAGAPLPSRRIADAYQRLPVPASHGPTVGAR